MARCTNLHLDTPGLAITRAGSSKINSSAMGETAPHLLLEMASNRYAFSGTKAYMNECEIGSNFTNSRWSAIEYNAYNVTDQSIFAVNGTDRKRIPGTSTITTKYDYGYAHSWESENVSGTTYQFGSTRNNYQCWFDWEEPANSDDEELDDSVFPRRYLWIFEGAIPQNWGIAAPTLKPYLFSDAGPFTSRVSGYAFCHEWEGQIHATTASYRLGTYRQWTEETIVPVVPSRTYVSIGNDEDGFPRYFPNVSETVTITYSYAQVLFDWEKTAAETDAADKRFLWFFEGATSYTDTAVVGVKYTWCRKNGATLECESNPSPAEYTQGITAITAAWYPPPDGQITHVRVYRTLEGGATFFFAAEFEADDLAATFNVQDEELGSAVATDHDQPPQGTVVAGPTYNGYCFMIKDNLLYYCKPNQPEYWPANYYIEVGPPQEELTAIQIHNGIPYIMSTEEIYMIQGTSADSFFPFPMKAKVGTLANIGVLSIGGQGIVHSDIEGLFQFKGANEDNKFADDKMRPLFTGVTTGSIPGLNRTYVANCWLLSYNNRLWFGYPDTTETYPGNVIIFDLLTLRARHYQYPFEMGHAVVDGTNNRILALDSTGYVRVLDDSTVTTDDGTAISWQIESKAFTDQLYKYFPRYAKYDVTLGSGATAIGYILLNDTSAQSHTLSTSRATVKRHITGSNGDRLGIRLAGTGTVTIREVEVE